LQHPVYFCDGATTPLLGYDVVSAASLVIDTEARQVWSKHTAHYGHTEPFTPPTTEPSTAANPATVRRSSITASTTVNSTATDPSTVNNASTTTSTAVHCHQPVTRPPFVNYYVNYRRTVYYYSIRYYFNYPRHYYYAAGDRSFAVVRVIGALSPPPHRLYFFTDYYRPR